ncbi:unnamed protein product [Ectocarpus sp. 12 AP-2014]
MAPVKRARSGSKKTSAGATTRSYTVLRKPTIDPKKKVSSQGKAATTTKTGAHLARRQALKRRTRPSRIYLYRNKKITTYSIKYGKNKDGKLTAVAKLLRTVTVKRKTKTKPRKKTSTSKKKTKPRKKSGEVAKLKRTIARLRSSLR